MAKTGRRPGASGTREAILESARRGFAERGYAQTTIRGVAGDAGVDPALVLHYFGSKDRLFAAALELPLKPAEALPAILEGDRDRLGERLVRFVLTTWDSPASGPLHALFRSAATNEHAAKMLREFVTTEMLGRLMGALDAPDADLRTNLVGSQMTGLIFTRYVVRIEPIASSDPETLVAAVAPNVQRYLTGELGTG